MASAHSHAKVLNRWVAKIIPLLLVCTVGYATYVVVALISVDDLLKKKKRPGAAVPILTIYFTLLLLMSLTYARLLYIVNSDPGYVPLGPRAMLKKKRRTEPARTGSSATDGTFSSSYENTLDRTNPDCPGLENFYTRDIFACEPDGRPRWCTECENWRPERSHHCREIGRCVRKMDHFCPWVGGVVGETSFKFFIQFVAYTSLYCTFVLIVSAIYFSENHVRQWISTMVLSSFFGLFTFSMTVNSVRFALTNLSSIEILGYKTQFKYFAVLVPRVTTSDVTPPPYLQVVYPLPLAPTEGRSNGSLDDRTNVIASQHERDCRAVRVFAVIPTDFGENPYDLGMVANWKDVMGEHVWDWFLPIRRSPCCHREPNESEFKLGDAVRRARHKNGLIEPAHDNPRGGVEMSQR